MIYNNANAQVNTMESHELKKLEDAKYVVKVDLADVLRAYMEGMVTAFNLGLMERNMQESQRGTFCPRNKKGEVGE